MIGGIFETIGKTLGIGQEKYFLELDDAAEDSVQKIKESATKAVEVAKEVSADVVEKAQDLASDASDSAEATAKSAAKKAKANAKSTVGDAKEAVDEAANETDKKQAAKKAVKEAKANAKKKKPTFGKKSSKQPSLTTGEAPDVAESATPAAPAAVDPEELIVAAIAATASDKKLDSQGNVVEAPTSFADDYLMPLPKSRRRPGPSFSGYKEMAKEVNTRLK